MTTEAGKLVVSTTMTPVEIGAMFLSCLAYPKDRQKRAKYFGALIYYGYAKLPASVGYGMAIRGMTHLIKSECNASVQDILNQGQLVISSKRLIAAKMAYPTFATALTKEWHGLDLPQSAPSFGSVAMMESIARDLQDPARKSKRGRKPKTASDPRNDANILNRQWKESRASLALALTVHEYCRTQGDDSFQIDSLFADQDLAWRLCKYAAAINGIVVQNFELKQYVQIILQD